MFPWKQAPCQPHPVPSSPAPCGILRQHEAHRPVGVRLLCARRPPAGLDPRARPQPPWPAQPRQRQHFLLCRLQTVPLRVKAAARPTEAPTPRGRARDPCPEVSRSTSRNRNPTFWFCSLCCPAGLQRHRRGGAAQRRPELVSLPAAVGRAPLLLSRAPSAVSHGRTRSCHQPAASGHRPAPYGAGVKHLLQVGTCSSQSHASTHLSQGTPVGALGPGTQRRRLTTEWHTPPACGHAVGRGLQCGRHDAH